MLLQEGIHICAQPGWLAKFKCVAMIWRQCLQELRQSLSVLPPFGWKLKKDWAKLLAQCFSAGKKIIQRVLRIFELLVVRQEPAGLHRKLKMIRHRGCPTAHDVKLW